MAVQRIGLNSPTDLNLATRSNYIGANTYLAERHACIYNPPPPTTRSQSTSYTYATTAQPIAQLPGAGYIQSLDASSYSHILKTFIEQQSPTAGTSNMSIPSYSPFVKHSDALALASANFNKKPFGVGGSPTIAVTGPTPPRKYLFRLASATDNGHRTPVVST